MSLKTEPHLQPYITWDDKIAQSTIQQYLVSI